MKVFAWFIIHDAVLLSIMMLFIHDTVHQHVYPIQKALLKMIFHFPRWDMSRFIMIDLLPGRNLCSGRCCELSAGGCERGRPNLKLEMSLNPFEQRKKPWLFRLYRGLYYPIIWGF